MAGLWPIRPAAPEDVPAIARLERRCFGDPWSESGIGEMLQDETNVVLVAESPEMPEPIAGYVFGRTAAGEGEILNLAVVPEARRSGLGRTLLEAGLAELERRGATEVYLEVRESNAAARGLYLAAGFRPSGVRMNYYRRPRENAVVLRRVLGGSE